MKILFDCLHPLFLLASFISVFHNTRELKPIQTFYEVVYFPWLLILYQLMIFLDFPRIFPDHALKLVLFIELTAFFFILKLFLRLLKLSMKPSVLLLGIFFTGLIPFLLMTPAPLKSLLLPGLIIFSDFLFFFAYQYNPSFALKKTCLYLGPSLFLTAIAFSLHPIQDPYENILSTTVLILLFLACYFTNLFLHKIAFESRIFSLKHVLFRLLCALGVYFIIFFYTTHINLQCSPILIKILALTASLIPLMWELIVPFIHHKIFMIFFPVLGDYFKRLEICRPHLRSLLKMEDFYCFVSALFKEFFNCEEFFLISIDSQKEQIKIIDTSGEKKFKVESDIKTLENFFSIHAFYDTQWTFFQDEQIEDIFRRLTGHLKNLTCIKMGTALRAPIFVAVLLKPKSISSWELEQIQAHSEIFLDCLNRCFIYEQKRQEMMTRIHETEEDFDTSLLASENLELQKSYEKIKLLQSDLLSKERKAALTKFSISLDDEISTPLSNMVMGVEYHLEKLKTGKELKQEDLLKLLDIIITQSLRIKKILEELRQVSTRYPII